MNDPAIEWDGLKSDPAPELSEGRLWVDGCFDFFHHGEFKHCLLVVMSM